MLRFQEAMLRDGVDRKIAMLPSLMMAARYRTEGRAECERRIAMLKAELDAERKRAEEARKRGATLLKSIWWRITSLLR